MSTANIILASITLAYGVFAADIMFCCYSINHRSRGNKWIKALVSILPTFMVGAFVFYINEMDGRYHISLGQGLARLLSMYCLYYVAYTLKYGKKFYCSREPFHYHLVELKSRSKMDIITVVGSVCFVVLTVVEVMV